MNISQEIVRKLIFHLKDGSLTGYGGTINHKIKLLELEQVDMNNLYRPKIQLNHNTFILLRK